MFISTNTCNLLTVVVSSSLVGISGAVGDEGELSLSLFGGSKLIDGLSGLGECLFTTAYMLVSDLTRGLFFSA